VAAIVTLRDSTRIGGAFTENSFVALYPYDRDLYLSEVWKLDHEGRFVARVAGTRGLYLDKADILYMELFDYQAVVESALRRKEQEAESGARI